MKSLGEFHRIKSTVVFLSLIWLFGCAGTGTRTLIKAKINNHIDPDKFLRDNYPHLIISEKNKDGKVRSDSDRVVVIKSTGEPVWKVNRLNTWKNFQNVLAKNYSVSDAKNYQELAFHIRDRFKHPPYLQNDALKKLNDTKTAIIISDDSSIDEKRSKINNLEAQLLNVPDINFSTTVHHYLLGDIVPVYYYYPRISVDFSSRLLSHSINDQFSLLCFIIVLQDTNQNDNSDLVRFLDYSPKAADLIEYTRGQYTGAVALAGSSSLTGTTTDQAAKTVDDITNTEVSGWTPTGNLSFTLTESYVNDLKDAIERRNTGVLKDGRVFFAEFRSAREKRIGGTYNFDLMLEVPANGDWIYNNNDKETKYEHNNNWYFESVPILSEVKANIYLIGVKRLVYKAGKVGVFKKVPEVERDHVFEQVIIHSREDVTLWNFDTQPWAEEVPVSAINDLEVKVITNHENAVFVLKDSKDKVLATGQGKNAVLKVKALKHNADFQGTVEFFNVFQANEKGSGIQLHADNGNVTVKQTEIKTLTKPIKKTVLGNYKLN